MYFYKSGSLMFCENSIVKTRSGVIGKVISIKKDIVMIEYYSKAKDKIIKSDYHSSAIEIYRDNLRINDEVKLLNKGDEIFTVCSLGYRNSAYFYNLKSIDGKVFIKAVESYMIEKCDNTKYIKVGLVFYEIEDINEYYVVYLNSFKARIHVSIYAARVFDYTKKKEIEIPVKKFSKVKMLNNHIYYGLDAIVTEVNDDGTYELYLHDAESHYSNVPKRLFKLVDNDIKRNKLFFENSNKKSLIDRYKEYISKTNISEICKINKKSIDRFNKKQYN